MSFNKIGDMIMKLTDSKKHTQTAKSRVRRTPAGVRIRSGVRAGYDPGVVYGPAGYGLFGNQR